MAPGGPAVLLPGSEPVQAETGAPDGPCAAGSGPSMEGGAGAAGGTMIGDRHRPGSEPPVHGGKVARRLLLGVGDVVHEQTHRRKTFDEDRKDGLLVPETEVPPFPDPVGDRPTGRTPRGKGPRRVPAPSEGPDVPLGEVDGVERAMGPAVQPLEQVRRRDAGGDPDLDDVVRSEKGDEGVQLERGVDLDVGAPAALAMG